MGVHEKESEESIPLLEDYLGVGRRTLTVLVAIVAGVFVAATLIYIGMFGFQRWKTNMVRAGSLMVISYTTPVAAQVDPQYVCPNCGVAKQPGWTPDGTPVCPTCGAQLGLR